MTAPVIISSVFLFLSIAVTVCCFTVFRKKTGAKFIGASAAVYASACLMILLLAIFKKDLPVLFFILADVLSGGVFVLTSLMMVFLIIRNRPEPKKSENAELEKDG